MRRRLGVRMPLGATPDRSGAIVTSWGGGDYWQESRRPLASLLFVAPILAAYEAGVIALGPRAVRNGADVWLRGFLDWLDLGQYFLLPALTVSILLGWHYVTRQPWRIGRGVLATMLAESALLAFALRVVLQAEIAVWQQLAGPEASLESLAATSPPGCGALAGAIGFLGAGVYEELLFRLILLGAAAWYLRRQGFPEGVDTAAAVLGTSLVFSAAHYVGAHGEPVEWLAWTFWFGAAFRFLAGAFFGALFVARGFGIAVGAHAGYDILVRLL